jgi:hypothetical protein
MWINGGQLNMIHSGTIFGFYEPDTRDIKSKPAIAIGEVLYSNLNAAYVKLNNNKKLSEQEANSLWGYILEKNYGSHEISLKLQTENRIQFDSIVNILKDFAYIKLVEHDSPDLLLEYRILDKTPGNYVTLTHQTDLILLSEEAPDIPDFKILNKIMDNIRQYGQSKFLRNLSNENSEYSAEIKIIPQQVKPGMESLPEVDAKYERVANMEPFYQDGSLALKPGTRIKFQITNNSPFTLHYTVIVLTPDYKFSESNNFLLPLRDRVPSEYSIQPFGSVNSNIFAIDKPYGVDHVLLITSKSAIDLRRIARSRGAGIRSGVNLSIEKLFIDSFKEEVGTRSASSTNLMSEEIGIFKTHFKIIPEDQFVTIK